MESAKANGGRRNLRIKITPVITPVERIGSTGYVETALAAPGDEVVRVDALDASAHLGDPGGEDDQVARGAGEAGEVTGLVGAAVWVVGELQAKIVGELAYRVTMAWT